MLTNSPKYRSWAILACLLILNMSLAPNGSQWTGGLDNSVADSKQVLGIEYEFYFYVEDLEGNRLYEIGNSTLSEQVISITRFAVLENEKVRVRLMLHG